MAYFSPYIDSSGLHIPGYIDIRDNLLEAAKNIFGQDIYLETDSQDYQFISIFSQRMYDTLLVAQYVYNSRGPSTAIGTGLDVILKLNGIKREPAVYSTCLVNLTGSPNTIINNGVVADKNGINWDLPSSVTLNSSGTITVMATCEVSGPVIAEIGDINTIVTATFGWASVTNSVAAIVGKNIESEALVRSRQSVSTTLPSQTIKEGIQAAILAIPSVNRVKVYENDTKVVDSFGLPANSITSVVENGTILDIATAIYNHKTPGCYTNGAVSQVIYDKYGDPTTIRFDRPSYVPIDVVVNVKSLQGYTSDTTNQIKTLISGYLNSLSIGRTLINSSLWGVTMQAMLDITNPSFSVTSLTMAKHGESQGVTDITMAYNEVAQGILNNIIVNVTS